MAEYISVGDKQLLISLQWKEKEGRSKRSILNEIKKEAKESHNRFGYISDFKKISIEDKTGSCQYLLMPSSNDSILLGSAIISSVFTDSVFIKKIDSDNLEDSRFWVCAIDIEGLIYEEGDKIIESGEELEVFVTEMKSLYELKIVGCESDLNFLDITLDIKLDEDFLNSYLDSKEYTIKELIKEKTVNKKYIIGTIGTVAIIVGTFLAFYEDQKFNDFENGVFSQDITPLSKNLNQFKKENNKKGRKVIYTQKQYSNIGKKMFRDYYESSFFDNKDIINNITYLDTILEPFAMEWKLSKMAFEKNEFLIIYDRVPNSTGVFKDLDLYIDKVSQSNKIISISPVALVSSGNRRVYKVSFGDNIKEKTYIARKLAESSQISKDKIVADLEKDAISIQNDINSTTMNIKDLNILERLFSDEVLIAHDNVLTKISKLRKIYKSINEEIKKEDEEVEINANTYSGSELKYIEISQRDNLFQWSYPGKFNNFPNLKLTKSNENLKDFAQSYKVQIASIEDVSAEIIYMEDALNLINKPYIQIKNVEIAMDTNKWSITSEVYEGIYEYNIADEPVTQKK